MYKQLFLIFLFLISTVQAADVSEIWITPENSDFTRLSTGFAGRDNSNVRSSQTC
jgi:hypothetical protein